jgi:hypothetical protein
MTERSSTVKNPTPATYQEQTHRNRKASKLKETSKGWRHYNDAEIDKIILDLQPKRGPKIEFTDETRSKLWDDLEKAANWYDKNLYSQSVPTIRKEIKHLQRIQKNLESVLDELGIIGTRNCSPGPEDFDRGKFNMGVYGERFDHWRWGRNFQNIYFDELRRAVLETKSQVTDTIQNKIYHKIDLSINGVANLKFWVDSIIERKQRESENPSIDLAKWVMEQMGKKPRWPWKADGSLNNLLVSLAQIYLDYTKRKPTASVDAYTYDVGGPFISYLQAVVQPLGINKSDNALYKACQGIKVLGSS